MKFIVNLVGALGVLVGGLWVLQGANILPGSFMSGQGQWLVIGALVLLVSAGALYVINFGRRR